MNARRKLKGAVLAAVSSPRWTSFYSDPTLDPYPELPADDDVCSTGQLSTLNNLLLVLPYTCITTFILIFSLRYLPLTPSYYYYITL